MQSGDSSDSGGDDAPLVDGASSSEGGESSSSDDGLVDDDGNTPPTTIGPVGEPIPICGDGYVDPGEECDGDNGGLSCTDLGFAGGWLRCNNLCELDTVACDMCGNDVVDPGEACDGNVYEGACSCTSTCARFGAECRPSSLVITEIFTSPIDPASGNAGQWFELYNHESVARNLQGCVVFGEGPEEKFEIDRPVPIPANGFVTIAAGDRSELGMEPAFIMSPRFVLERDADLIAIMCDGIVLDRVRYDTVAPWPEPKLGRSIEVHHLDATLNDNGLDWCPGRTVFGIGHSGTPNLPNDCH